MVTGTGFCMRSGEIRSWLHHLQLWVLMHHKLCKPQFPSPYNGGIAHQKFIMRIKIQNNNVHKLFSIIPGIFWELNNYYLSSPSGNGQFPFQSQRRAMPKNVQTTAQLHSFRIRQCMNTELPDVQAGFRKGRGTKDQIANIRWMIETAREFQINIYLFYWLC